MNSKADVLLRAGALLISATTVEGALYGFSFALYITCARSLYLQLQDRDWRRQNIFTLLYITIMMVFELFCLAVDSREIQTSFVDHADYPGGALGYAQNVFALLPIDMMEQVAFILLQVMLGSIQIWRLWIVWSNSRFALLIVGFPVLSFLALIGFITAPTILIARSEMTAHLVVVLLYGQLIPQLCLSVAVTIPIIVRILIVHKKNKEIMGQSADLANPYTSVIAILIESFALETVWTVFMVPLVPFQSVTAVTIRNFFAASLLYVQVFAYLLVVYRATTGRGWKEDTAEKLTTLEWNRDGLQTTQGDTQTCNTMAHNEA